jgi:hypothetical protein
MRLQHLKGTAALVASAVAALVGCASDGAAQSADPLVGTHWALLNVAKDGAGSVLGSAAPDTWLEVSSSYGLLGRDGCSGFQADSHRTGRTLTITNVRMAANGCLPDHGSLDATRAAVDAMLAGPRVHLSVSSSRLTISTGDYTLVYTGTGPASPSTNVGSMTTSPSASQ